MSNMKRSCLTLSSVITSTFLVMVMLVQPHGSHSFSLPYPFQPSRRVITDEDLGWAAIPYFIRHSARGFLSAGHMAGKIKASSMSVTRIPLNPPPVHPYYYPYNPSQLHVKDGQHPIIGTLFTSPIKFV